MSVTLRTLTVSKPGEVYVIAWLPEQVPEAYRQLGRWASDKSLSFTWHDAVRVAAQLDLHLQEQRA